MEIKECTHKDPTVRGTNPPECHSFVSRDGETFSEGANLKAEQVVAYPEWKILAAKCDNTGCIFHEQCKTTKT